MYLYEAHNITTILWRDLPRANERILRASFSSSYSPRCFCTRLARIPRASVVVNVHLVIPLTHAYEQPQSWSTSDRNRRLSPVDVKPTHYSLSAGTEPFLPPQALEGGETERDDSSRNSRSARDHRLDPEDPSC